MQHTKHGSYFVTPAAVPISLTAALLQTVLRYLDGRPPPMERRWFSEQQMLYRELFSEEANGREEASSKL